MKTFSLLITSLCALALASCASSSTHSTGGEVVGVGSRSWTEPVPYGMVLVERGSIKAGPSKADSIWGLRADAKGISVDAFWMDETETTNAKYRQFVFWVRDSIIRERLADPAFGGNDEYKIEEDREGNPIAPRLNWSKPIPWRTADEDERRAIESLYRTNQITGAKELDETQLNFRYETFNYTESVKRRNRLDPLRREYNTDKPVDYEIPLITKDTAYVTDDGQIVRKTITRPRESDFDFINTYIVNVYPDTTAWVNDFENSFNEPYVKMYFSHGGYSEYPVVGVSWEQATAYAAWRTMFLRRALDNDGVRIEAYRLPTEAEWEYAARAGVSENKYPWAGDLAMSEDKGCFYANFKPQEGNYAKDGHVITSRVGSYAPNDFGLYDMAGNVSEWTSTAFTESISRLTPDLNPEYRYDASPDDPYRMKRKIVRGGSWKDVAHNIRSDLRLWEYQNEQRSYIGFRCVRTHIGFSKGQRKKNK